MTEFIMWSIKIISYSVIIYLVYVLVFGILLFKFHKPKKSDYKETHTINRFYGSEVSQDKIHLAEGRYYANQVMNNLFRNAEKSIDLSYYMINDGLAAKVLTYHFLKAADRGVKIRLLLDGFANNVFNRITDYLYIFEMHPNIEVKFYEPFKLYRPSTWNNRLHDKLIIIDDHKYGLIGGQNIDDKYLTKDGEKGMKFTDRDVVIINTNIESKETSITDMKRYFNQAFNHEYSKYPIKKLTNKMIQKGNKKRQSIMSFINDIVIKKPELFKLNVNFEQDSLPTYGVHFIYNPIQRMNKDPWCFYDISRLINHASKSVLIENPFVIPVQKMFVQLFKRVERKNITILTNSLATNSHVYAHAGYVKYRKNMIANGVKLYEYQGKDIIHAKSFIIDQRISLVGAYNLDARSTYLSTETMVVIDSEDFARKLEEKIKGKMNKSLKINGNGSYEEDATINKRKVPIIKRVLYTMFYPIAYILDFML